MESSIRRTFAQDGTAMVTVRGEIDYANADELAACIGEAVTDGSPSTVQVDLRDASFIDSTGLGALIEGFHATTDADAVFLVTNPSAAFRRVLTVTGLCEFFGLSELGGSDADHTQATETAQATGT